MDGIIFALISPMVIKEFSLTVPQYRSGLQIALFIGICFAKPVIGAHSRDPLARNHEVTGASA